MPKPSWSSSINWPIPLSGTAPRPLSTDLSVLTSPRFRWPISPDSIRLMTSSKSWKPVPLRALVSRSAKSYILLTRRLGLPVTIDLSFRMWRTSSATASSIWPTGDKYLYLLWALLKNVSLPVPGYTRVFAARSRRLHSASVQRSRFLRAWTISWSNTSDRAASRASGLSSLADSLALSIAKNTVLGDWRKKPSASSTSVVSAGSPVKISWPSAVTLPNFKASKTLSFMSSNP